MSSLIAGAAGPGGRRGAALPGQNGKIAFDSRGPDAAIAAADTTTLHDQPGRHVPDADRPSTSDFDEHDPSWSAGRLEDRVQRAAGGRSIVMDADGQIGLHADVAGAARPVIPRHGRRTGMQDRLHGTHPGSAAGTIYVIERRTATDLTQITPGGRGSSLSAGLVAGRRRGSLSSSCGVVERDRTSTMMNAGRLAMITASPTGPSSRRSRPRLVAGRRRGSPSRAVAIGHAATLRAWSIGGRDRPRQPRRQPGDFEPAVVARWHQDRVRSSHDTESTRHLGR